MTGAIVSETLSNHINPTPDRLALMVGQSKMLFDPKADITTYELALCMDVFLSGIAGSKTAGPLLAAEKFNNLPPNVRRHFVSQTK
jgi:hypothetical protein